MASIRPFFRSSPPPEQRGCSLSVVAAYKERSSKVEVVEKEIDEGVRAKCIPRKPRATTRKEANPPISRSTHGSKRINDEPSQFEQ